MRILGLILWLFLLLPLSSCVNCSIPENNETSQTQNTVLIDKVEANLMNLYSAASANRNALHEEANIGAPTTSMRILTNRNRTINQNVTIRHTLLSTHKPVVSKLIHHPVTQFIALPKEYHIFRLRRILI